MSKNDDFIKIFMYFNAKTAQKHIEFYMNNNYRTAYHTQPVQTIECTLRKHSIVMNKKPTNIRFYSQCPKAL